MLVWPDISIVLIVKNELSNLSELIPLLLKLEYNGKFNVHILDDASSDRTSEFIYYKYSAHEQVKFHFSPYSYSIGKKKRLMGLGEIKTFPIVLFTDADCRPDSKWLSSMATHSKNHDIVLGFSPYYKDNSFINKVIQFETGLTALLYMGLANLGLAYMGVGRNILYTKKVLIGSKNLYKYNELLSGDDDLTVNELREMNKICINLEPESFVYSIPKTTISDWIKQKQRHVSTARHYNPIDKVLLFTYYSGHLTWWIGIALFIFIDVRLAIIGIVLKLVWLFTIRLLHNKIFKYIVTWSSMMSADVIYSLSLIYLLPAATLRKLLKW